MNQLKLSKWLKAVIFGAGICGAILYFYEFPFWGDHIVSLNPEFSFWYWPWLIFLWITAIPCYATLVLGWKITNSIQKNHSFCYKNANLLKRISIFAASDSVFFFIGNMIFLLLHINYLEIILLALFVVFSGVAVSVTAAVLSHLVYKAAQIREESELTI